MTVFTHALSTNNYGSHKFIVDASAANGTNTTITSAITSATNAGGNQTIMIRPGTYTEDFTLPANINLVANVADAFTPAVTISGKITCTDAGTRSISGVTLASNGAEFLSVTGNAETIVNLIDCVCNTAFDPGITFSSSSASAAITMRECAGNISASAKKFFAHSSSGAMGFSSCNFNNTGASTTASTISAGLLVISKCGILFPITTSGTSAIVFEYNNFDTSAQNVTTLTCGGSGSSAARWCEFVSGSASAVSIGSTLAMIDCNILSSNTNSVTGAGTLTYSPFTFQGTSKLINTTTQTPMNFGSWTPTIDGATPGTTTYVTQSGYYTVLGNLCHIECLINISAATGTGNATLGGLPFTIKNLTQYSPICALYFTGAWTWPGTATQLLVTGVANTKTATIVGCKSGATVANLQMTNAAAAFIFSLTYEI